MTLDDASAATSRSAFESRAPVRCLMRLAATGVAFTIRFKGGGPAQPSPAQRRSNCRSGRGKHPERWRGGADQIRARLELETPCGVAGASLHTATTAWMVRVVGASMAVTAQRPCVLKSIGGKAVQLPFNQRARTENADRRLPGTLHQPCHCGSRTTLVIARRAAAGRRQGGKEAREHGVHVCGSSRRRVSGLAVFTP